MIPIPAIDLKDGKVVRLLHGNFDAEQVYGENAKEIALHFAAEGAKRLHVVDLDGALKGEPKNLESIRELLAVSSIPVEVGGGIRDLKQAARYLGMGARWVIFGTQACLDPGFLREAIAELGDSVIIGIDAKDGFVATDGWTKVIGRKAVSLAREVEACGGKTVIYTDIATDGALSGPNLAHIEALADEVSIQIIASGGVGSLKDLKFIKELGKPNVSGVIIGRAIYEKKFTIKEAISACS